MRNLRLQERAEAAHDSTQKAGTADPEQYQQGEHCRVFLGMFQSLQEGLDAAAARRERLAALCRQCEESSVDFAQGSELLLAEFGAPDIAIY